MRADPEPYDTVWRIHTDCSVAETDTSRPEASYLLEVQRRMVWVLFQQLEGFVSKITDRSGEGVIANPEIR